MPIIFPTVRPVHHDGWRDDADADEEVGDAQGQDEAVGHCAKFGSRHHGENDQEVADL